MKDGFIQQIGTPQQVFDRPHNVFVAGFIGSPQMNFFDARLERAGASYFVEVEGTRIQLPEDMNKRLTDKGTETQEITLGIRPEHIALAEPYDENGIKAKVDVSEMMGSEVYLHVDMSGRDVVIRVQTIGLPVQYRHGLPFGTELRLTLPATLVHLFHKETGVNLID